MRTDLQPPVDGVSWEIPADLSQKETQDRLRPSAIRAFIRIAAVWKLQDEDARKLLGGVSSAAFYQAKRGATKKLDQDKLTRISLLVGIFKALNILYSKKLADQWVGLSNANTIFGGNAPLSYMIRGGIPAMVRVRQLLDARYHC